MISCDFSSEEDFYMLYSFMFCYIQEGALDNYKPNNNKEFNNVFLIFDKVINRMNDFVDKGFYKLSSLGKSDEEGFKLSSSEVNDVYKSENFYYMSFLAKISKFLYILPSNSLLRGDLDARIIFIL